MVVRKISSKVSLFDLSHLARIAHVSRMSFLLLLLLLNLGFLFDLLSVCLSELLKFLLVKM